MEFQKRIKNMRKCCINGVEGIIFAWKIMYNTFFNPEC